MTTATLTEYNNVDSQMLEFERLYKNTIFTYDMVEPIFRSFKNYQNNDAEYEDAFDWLRSPEGQAMLKRSETSKKYTAKQVFKYLDIHE